MSQRSAPDKAQTLNPSTSSQSLYLLATAVLMIWKYKLSILKKSRNATDGNIIFACLKYGLVKSPMEISN